VDRNRLKRRLREVLRLDLLPAGGGVDVVVRASPRAYTLPFATLRAEIGEALGRAAPVKPQ
jgi:ribonuclease P protein component